MDRNTGLGRRVEQHRRDRLRLNLPSASAFGKQLDARRIAPPPDRVTGGSNEASALDRGTDPNRIEQLAAAWWKGFSEPRLSRRPRHDLNAMAPRGEQSRGPRPGRAAADDEDFGSWLNQAIMCEREFTETCVGR